MEKINVAELLHNCPEGMELDCTAFNNVKFQCADNDGIWIEYIDSDNDNRVIYLTCEGGIKIKNIETKCVIFPKGKTTWEGFHRPFKDGEIVASNSGSQVFIFKEYVREENNYAYCYVFLNDDGTVDFECDSYFISRLATEEEKQRLFDAIKAHGYRWNAENKTLEKLIEPKFKVGDRIKRKDADVVHTIKEVGTVCYVFDDLRTIHINVQDNYKLVPNKFDINTLVPFESRVLVRAESGNLWKPAIFGCYMKDKYAPFYVLGGTSWKQCIPYEGNQHLLCKTTYCDEYFKTWK